VKFVAKHLSHLLDHLPQLSRHFRKGNVRYLHLAVDLFNGDVEFRELRIFVRIIITKLSTAALFVRLPCDRFGNSQQIAIKPRQPGLKSTLR
jgi:hypothetical protein